MRGASEESSRMQVSVRIDKDVMRDVDHFSVDSNTYRSEAMERLIKEGLKAIQYKPGQGVAPDR